MYIVQDVSIPQSEFWEQTGFTHKPPQHIQGEEHPQSCGHEEQFSVAVLHAPSPQYSIGGVVQLP